MEAPADGAGDEFDVVEAVLEVGVERLGGAAQEGGEFVEGGLDAGVETLVDVAVCPSSVRRAWRKRGALSSMVVSSRARVLLERERNRLGCGGKVAEGAEGGEALAVHVGGEAVRGLVVVVNADLGLGGMGAVEAPGVLDHASGE